MKKICLLVFSFLIFLLSFSFFSAKSDLVFAKAYGITENLAASSSSKPENINYTLPYPGLLPDSPLYFFRIIRDRTVGFLISDPLRKAEFNLLQADKRLNAGIFLFNKGKISLSLSTVSKAENYFEQVLDKLGEAKMQGRNINEMEEKLRQALGKHKQELEYLTQKANANFRDSFKKELKRVTDFEQRLNQ